MARNGQARRLAADVRAGLQWPADAPLDIRRLDYNQLLQLLLAACCKSHKQHWRLEGLKLLGDYCAGAPAPDAALVTFITELFGDRTLLADLLADRPHEGLICAAEPVFTLLARNRALGAECGPLLCAALGGQKESARAGVHLLSRVVQLLPPAVAGGLREWACGAAPAGWPLLPCLPHTGVGVLSALAACAAHPDVAADAAIGLYGFAAGLLPPRPGGSVAAGTRNRVLPLASVGVAAREALLWCLQRPHNEATGKLLMEACVLALWGNCTEQFVVHAQLLQVIPPIPLLLLLRPPSLLPSRHRPWPTAARYQPFTLPSCAQKKRTS